MGPLRGIADYAREAHALHIAGMLGVDEIDFIKSRVEP